MSKSVGFVGAAGALLLFAATAAASLVATSSVVPNSLFGNAKPRIPAGVPGKVALVVIGRIDHSAAGTTVPVMVRNRTKGTVSDVDVSGIATIGGRSVGAGDSQGFEPGTVGPGQVDLGYVFFQNAIPKTAKLKLIVSSSPGASTSRVDLRVKLADYTPGGQSGIASVSGVAENVRATPAQPPQSVDVYCFSKLGALLATGRGFLNGSKPIRNHATASFQVNLFSACPTFLVGAAGYSF